MLKLIDVKKDYKVADSKVHALKGIDLEFRKNEFVCILGPSGCGKTTLLNIIGGLDQYTSGDLVIGGRSTKNFGDRDWDVYRNHQIGFIFQSYNLIPHQTVLGNVELALTIAGIGKEERRECAKQALERVGLGEELNKRPNQLSGGQMQRVAIARALVNNPAILLADEPTGALDSKTSVQIMDLIREISGERLVIMVTHNPELAESYASRIVCLKDGLVESDSDPYDGTEDREKEERRQEEELASLTPEDREKVKKEKKKRDSHAKMGFFTALALSARNLLTKKGRTIITSVAGSIGIISVCLVLALSSGFNNYIKRTEEDMLSYYPVQITESTYDMAAMMTSFTAQKDMPDLSELDNEVYIDSFLTGLANGMAVKNNITPEYVKYVNQVDDSWVSAIQYGYGVRLVDNLFTNVYTMEGDDETDLTRTTRSLSNLKTHYIEVLNRKAEEYSQLTYMADFFGNIVNKMPGTTNVGEEDFGKYVLSQYDIVQGTFPTNANEVVLVVGANNQVTDLTLAQLGFLDEEKFLSLFELGENKPVAEDTDRGYMTVDFDEVIGKEYSLFYNNAVYIENEGYEKPVANPFITQTLGYPYTYRGTRSELSATEEEGINLKISGILRLKEGLTYGCLKSGLNLTEQAVNDYIKHNMQSDIVQWTKNDSEFIMPTGGTDSVTLYLSPAAQLDDYYAPLSQYIADNPLLAPLGGIRIAVDPERAIRALGGSDVINSISIYATDFDGKDALLAHLDQWNETHEESEKITYSDTVGLLMQMMQTMLDTITYVLVAFTAISLVVSSVMIGIITYVSVVERVKEIGVLRALGARKRDIRNLFNAETFIIGLAAGLIGIAVTYLLSIVINVVMFSLTGISGIAALPVLSAFIMVLVSVGLTLISGLIPASAAAKKDPVIALRTE